MTALEIAAAEPSTLALTAITRDLALACRAAGVDSETVTTYAEAMKAGAQFPAVIVFRAPDGTHFLGDGFHRCAAAELAGLTDIAADVRTGGRLEALLFAASANATHGRPRSPDDKRRAVLALRAEPEWARRSARWIAEQCKVSPTFVTATLATVHGGQSSETEGKDGKTRKAPKRPKRKPFDAAREVKAAARAVDLVAKRWPPGAPVEPLIEALSQRLAELQKRAAPAVGDVKP